MTTIMDIKFYRVIKIMKKKEKINKKKAKKNKRRRL